MNSPLYITDFIITNLNRAISIAFPRQNYFVLLLDIRLSLQSKFSQILLKMEENINFGTAI